jgi:hypothetical protein
LPNPDIIGGKNRGEICHVGKSHPVFHNFCIENNVQGPVKIIVNTLKNFFPIDIPD